MDNRKLTIFHKLKRKIDNGIHMIKMPIRKNQKGQGTSDLLTGVWKLDLEFFPSDANCKAMLVMRGESRAKANFLMPLVHTHQVGGHLISLWHRGTGERIMTSFPLCPC